MISFRRFGFTGVHGLLSPGLREQNCWLMDTEGPSEGAAPTRQQGQLSASPASPLLPQLLLPLQTGAVPQPGRPPHCPSGASCSHPAFRSHRARTPQSARGPLRRSPHGAGAPLSSSTNGSGIPTRARRWAKPGPSGRACPCGAHLAREWASLGAPRGNQAEGTVPKAPEGLERGRREPGVPRAAVRGPERAARARRSCLGYRVPNGGPGRGWGSRDPGARTGGPRPQTEVPGR